MTSLNITVSSLLPYQRGLSLALNTRVIQVILILSLTIVGQNLAWSEQVESQQRLIALEEQIVKEETRFNDIVPGTQKSIYWVNGVVQSDISIVYLHGFSASSQELSPVVENIANILQANIFYARLQGHGRSSDAMGEATLAGWQDDALQAYAIGRAIGKKVVVISTSTGGTLATWLNSQITDESFLANILVSPNFGVHNKSSQVLKWPLGLQVAKLLMGPYHEFRPLNELHRTYWTERYPLEAVIPMIELVDLVDDLNTASITTPQLYLYSPRDKVIRVDKIEEMAERLTSAKVTLSQFTSSTDPYQHVLGGRACSPESTDELVQLMAKYIVDLEADI